MHRFFFPLLSLIVTLFFLLPVLEIIHLTLVAWVERALILEKAVPADDSAYKTGEKTLWKDIKKKTIPNCCDTSSLQGYKTNVTVGNLGNT